MRYGGYVTDLNNPTNTSTTTLDDSETAVVAQAISIIDKELGHLASREMVTATELTNVLLDLRLLLSSPAKETKPVAEPVSV